eukprot:617848-Rhodomonas_salina.3
MQQHQYRRFCTVGRARGGSPGRRQYACTYETAGSSIQLISTGRKKAQHARRLARSIRFVSTGHPLARA